MLLGSREIFATEPGLNPRNILPAPPTNGASIAVRPAAIDAAAAKSSNALMPAELPPLPAGVTDIKFNEFFRQPIGSRGLEFTGKLRGLDGKRVRVPGYMVRQSQPLERCFLLTPVPVELNEDEYGCEQCQPAKPRCGQYQWPGGSSAIKSSGCMMQPASPIIKLPATDIRSPPTLISKC